MLDCHTYPERDNPFFNGHRSTLMHDAPTGANAEFRPQTKGNLEGPCSDMLTFSTLCPRCNFEFVRVMDELQTTVENCGVSSQII